MIKIIDYGMGNLHNVVRAFEAIGYKAEITRRKEDILKAKAVVLPGVGAFGDAMDNLEGLGLISPIKEVIAQGTPFLGICLGLQLLFEKSEEFGSRKGLGVFSGKVEKFSIPNYKIPHVGWNQLSFQKNTKLYDGLEEGVFQYFVHSYYVVTKKDKIVSTVTDYGIDFVSSVARDNVYAVQFHPEKSGDKGLKILDNFAKKIVE